MSNQPSLLGLNEMIHRVKLTWSVVATFGVVLSAVTVVQPQPPEALSWLANQGRQVSLEWPMLIVGMASTFLLLVFGSVLSERPDVTYPAHTKAEFEARFGPYLNWAVTFLFIGMGSAIIAGCTVAIRHI